MLCVGVEGPRLHRPENWLVRQLVDEPKPVYIKWDLLERKERLLEKCSVLGSWHSWGGQKFPRLALKPDPMIYDCLFLPA
jgi:hypothetical protein